MTLSKSACYQPDTDPNNEANGRPETDFSGQDGNKRRSAQNDTDRKGE